MRTLILASSFLFLVLVNVVQAEVLLSRCFHGGYANFYMQKLNEEHKFEINSTRTGLRETKIISDLRPDAIAQFGKIEVHSYKINYFDENIISAVGFAADGYIKQILTIEPKKQKCRSLYASHRGPEAFLNFKVSLIPQFPFLGQGVASTSTFSAKHKLI
jgi:hypothetical protein